MRSKLKVFEMFAGYGGGSFALKKLKIPFEVIGYSEIDKGAIKCFEQNHPNIKNYGDCSTIKTDDLPDFDLLTAGFPCQDVSLAGKRDLTKGRTLLVNHIFRIVKDKKPKWIVLENVKGLLSMKELWESIRFTLIKLGYDVKYKLLNSKDYGIPQNRERIWIICCRDGFKPFQRIFPEKEQLKLSVKDILETEVNERYFLTKKALKRLSKHINKNKGNISNCLTAGMYKKNWNTPIISGLQDHQTIRKDGTSPTLVKSMGDGGGHKPIIIDKNKNFKGNRIIDKDKYFSTLVCSQKHNDFIRVHSLFPRSSKTNKRGTGHLSKEDGTSYYLDTGNRQCLEYEDRYRYLTPKECFRLMGFLNDEINLEGLSDTQKYKLAGNGWDINIVYKIFKNLFN